MTVHPRPSAPFLDTRPTVVCALSRLVAVLCLHAGLMQTTQADSSVPQRAPADSWLYVARHAHDAAKTASPHDGDQRPSSDLDTARLRPLATISAALDRAVPGCAIIVQSGSESDPLIYEEQVIFDPRRSGTADRPIRLVAETPRGARIVGPRTGQGTLPDNPAEATTVLFSDAHDIELHNFQIENRGSGDADSAAVKVVIRPRSEVPANRIRIAGCRLYGQGRDGLKVAASREVEVYGNRIEGGPDWRESAIDGLSGFDHVIAWNTIRGMWKEGPAFKAGGMRLRFHGNDVEITRKPGRNSVALLIGELGWSNIGKRPMPFAGEDWRWAETQDYDIRGNRLVTDFDNAIWFRGSTDATVVGNFLGNAPGGNYARMLPSIHGLWTDQPTEAPPEYARFVGPVPGEPLKRMYHNRGHILADNHIAPGVVPEMAYAEGSIESDFASTHRIETPRVAADSQAVLPQKLGETAWDRTAVHRLVGLAPAP